MDSLLPSISSRTRILRRWLHWCNFSFDNLSCIQDSYFHIHSYLKYMIMYSSEDAIITPLVLKHGAPFAIISHRLPLRSNLESLKQILWKRYWYLQLLSRSLNWSVQRFSKKSRITIETVHVLYRCFLCHSFTLLCSCTFQRVNNKKISSWEAPFLYFYLLAEIKFTGLLVLKRGIPKTHECILCMNNIFSLSKSKHELAFEAFFITLLDLFVPQRRPTFSEASCFISENTKARYKVELWHRRIKRTNDSG